MSSVSCSTIYRTIQCPYGIALIQNGPKFLFHGTLHSKDSARHSETRLNPASTLDWAFAVAVLKLNRHPMSWLLRWASMEERRPWWDRWLLIAAALLVIIGFIALILIAGNDPWTRFQWTGIGDGCTAILILLPFASRRIEEGS